MGRFELFSDQSKEFKPMSKTKTETPVLRNSADIPWEENRPRHK